MTHRVNNLRIDIMDNGDTIRITSKNSDWDNTTSTIEFDHKTIPMLIESLKEIQAERIGKW